MPASFRFPTAALLLAGLLGAASCSQPAPTATAETTAAPTSAYFAGDTARVKTGGVQVIPISTPKGKFNVWTKRFGNNPRMKVLLLNGGPGATHEYFECMESFLPQDGIEFIYYDQLGCGLSDNPKDTAMWSLPRYVEEVEQVRQALRLDKDNFYLLGHSWGGILAAEYAFKYQQHLKGLVISNMMMSCPAYGKYAQDVLAKQMKPEVGNKPQSWRASCSANACSSGCAEAARSTSAALAGKASSETKCSSRGRSGSAFQACQVSKKFRPRPKPVSRMVHCGWRAQAAGRPQPCKKTSRACVSPPNSLR